MTGHGVGGELGQGIGAAPNPAKAVSALSQVTPTVPHPIPIPALTGRTEGVQKNTAAMTTVATSSEVSCVAPTRSLGGKPASDSCVCDGSGRYTGSARCRRRAGKKTNRLPAASIPGIAFARRSGVRHKAHDSRPRTMTGHGVGPEVGQDRNNNTPGKRGIGGQPTNSSNTASNHQCRRRPHGENGRCPEKQGRHYYGGYKLAKFHIEPRPDRRRQTG